MGMAVVGAIGRLIEEFGRLPGVGPKTAQRFTMYLLHRPPSEAESLADAILQARAKVRACGVCHNLTDVDPCVICRSPGRDHGVICVVEEAKDVSAMEKTHEFRGVYHVLGGSISPLAGRGPDDLRIDQLLRRLRTAAGSGGGSGRQDAHSHEAAPAAGPLPAPVREVILATDPDVEGDATALYLARLLKPLGIRVSRIARGVPEGGDLDYVDEVTLGRALAGRADI